MDNGLLFHTVWLSQQTGALQEAIALSKPTTIVNIRANENTMAMVDQCKQRGVLCHIGLVRGHSGHLVN